MIRTTFVLTALVLLAGCYQSVNGRPYYPQSEPSVREGGPRSRGVRSRHHDDDASRQSCVVGGGTCPYSHECVASIPGGDVGHCVAR